MDIDFSDSNLVLILIEKIASVGILIASTESLTKPETMRDNGLCSWKVHQLVNKWFIHKIFQKTIGRILEYRMALVLIFVRAICALLLLVLINMSPAFLATLTILIVVISFLLTVRSTYGRDGADQMLFLTFINLSIAHILNNNIASELTIWFLALQAGLSYITAGLSKWSSSIWRSGVALPGILGTRIYGNVWLQAVITRNNTVTKFACWGIILFECIFPIVFVGVRPITYSILILGILFHSLNAIFMRLNTFFWAFIATYPAILHCVSKL